MNELKSLLLGPPCWTLSAAESLTSGHVQARIGAISGASQFFLGGVTAYSLEQKVQLLHVDRALAEPLDCVSAEVAEQMARGACRLFGSRVSVATTGYAEPSPAWNIAEPFAYWALAFAPDDKPVVTRSGRVDCPGVNRVGVQTLVADTVIQELIYSLSEWRAGRFLASRS